MKEDELSPEEATNFVISAERFYLGMWFVNLPLDVCEEGAIGGDLTALLWRKIEPGSPWFLRYRFRYYFEETSFGKKDTRRWWFGEAEPMDDERKEEQMHLAMQMIARAQMLCGTNVYKVEYMPIHGVGPEAFLRAKELHNPYWMQSQESFAQ